MKCLVVLLLVALISPLAHASDVLSLNSKTFDQAIADNHLIAVEFFAPWCGHCKALAPEWEKAATELSGKVALASVDCTAEQNICQSFEVQGYPTLKLFRNSQPSPLEVNRKAEDIVSYLTEELVPVPKLLTTQAQIDTFASESAVVLVVYFATEEDQKYKEIAELAEQLRHVIPVGAVVDAKWDLNGKEFPLVTLHRKFGREKLVYEGELDFAALSVWIARSKVALLGEIHAGNYMDYINTGLPVGYLFLNPKEDNSDLISELEPTAERLKNNLVISWIDNSKYSQQAKRLGLSGEVIPAFALDDQHSGTKFLYPETQEILGGAEGGIAEWLDQYVAGELKPFVKSEPIPEDNEGPVKIVVGHTFESIVKDATKDVLLEFYAPWCGHCKQLAPVFEQLGERYRFAKDILIAKIDATANDVDPSYGVTGFPTILLFPAAAKDQPILYEGNRSLEDLISFVENTGEAKDDEEEEDDEGDDDNAHDEL